ETAPQMRWAELVFRNANDQDIAASQNLVVWLIRDRRVVRLCLNPILRQVYAPIFGICRRTSITSTEQISTEPVFGDLLCGATGSAVVVQCRHVVGSNRQVWMTVENLRRDFFACENRRENDVSVC